MTGYNLVSLGGLVALMLIAWALSTDHRRVNWRVVAWGVGLQFVFALLIFRVDREARVLRGVNVAVNAIVGAASAGAEFLFGTLAKPPGAEGSLGFFLAFQGLPTIVFFSALMAILYHIGVMQLIVRGFAKVFTRLMRISGAESLVAASNIFVGVESSLTVRPYLARMTASELGTVLTACMATVASNVLALYVSALQSTFSMIGAHLVSASLLSAPAAIVMSKLMMPESEQPETLGLDVRPEVARDPNLFQAIIHGANNGVRMVVGVAALLLAMLGLVALLNVILGAVGGWSGRPFGAEWHWSLEAGLGWVFRPFVALLGVPLKDVPAVAQLVGQRLVTTEVPSYFQLGALLKDGLVERRSAVICSYALCGFAHIPSMAIFVGGISAIAPEATPRLTRVAVRALIAATLACMMTACVAGFFCTDGTMAVLFGGTP